MILSLLQISIASIDYTDLKAKGTALMFRTGLRNLLDRLTRDMDAKAESTFGGLVLARSADDSARDEFITAYVVAREPVTVARTARLSRLPTGNEQ